MRFSTVFKKLGTFVLVVAVSTAIVSLSYAQVPQERPANTAALAGKPSATASPANPSEEAPTTTRPKAIKSDQANAAKSKQKQSAKENKNAAPVASLMKVWVNNVGIALYNNFVLVISLLAATFYTALAAYPVLTYARRGWFIKRDEILSSFSSDAKQLYLTTYLNHTHSGEDSTQRFDDLYRQRFGRHRFIGPLVLFSIAVFVAMFLVSETAMSLLALSNNGKPIAVRAVSQSAPFFILPSVAVAGICGAYMWIVWDMISRSRRLSLNPSDVLNASLRLALSAATGAAMAALLKDELGMPIAFAVGAFPIETVRTMLRRIATDKLGLGVGIEDDSPDQVINLDSVDHPIADRLLDADISTVGQLAYADPVPLSMRTGLSFDYIVDIASQALAWIYLGDRLDDLRSAGLRGAMEIHCFFSELASDKDNDAAFAKGLLAVVIGLPQDPLPPTEPNKVPIKRKFEQLEFLSACDQIANDPCTLFLIAVWRDQPIGAVIWPDFKKLGLI